MTTVMERRKFTARDPNHGRALETLVERLRLASGDGYKPVGVIKTVEKTVRGQRAFHLEADAFRDVEL